MKIRFLAIIFIIVNILCFNVFAETVFVVGSDDISAELTHTRFLDSKPVIFFSEQFIGSADVIEILTEVVNFVFCDTTWQDLAVEIAARSISYSQKFRVKIEKEGNFEFWLDCSNFDENQKKKEDWIVKIDNKQILKNQKKVVSQNTTMYTYIGEAELNRGIYPVVLKNVSMDLNALQLKMLILEEKERESTREILKQKVNSKKTDLYYILEKERGEFFIN
ncbi:MAG: hypothetical protein ABIG64_05740 [Candidatus Omnitrophota bacterium]